jgi:hypothetical protein
MPVPCLLRLKRAPLSELRPSGEHIVRSATNLCAWAPPGGPSIAGKKLVLDFKTTQAFEIGKTPIKSMTKTPVSGIGDDAYYAPPKH